MGGHEPMIVAIHQPHYFPWLGYLAKMASVDKFILMDTVQLEKRSYMIRNRIIDPDGQIRYLNLLCEKNNHFEREYRELRIKDNEMWISRQKGVIIRAYKKCKYFNEIWNAITAIFDDNHEFLCDVTVHSINILREILNIRTPLILQSDIQVDRREKKGRMILGLCKAIGANVYYAGRGASVQYLDIDKCAEEGIRVIYQNYPHPVYPQAGNHPFVSGLSALDLLFNCGIEKSREIFWNSVRKEDGYGSMARF